ncbi:MAG: EamA family transporter RarD [Robiginitomaculum sp.]|nr:EamA family transporter RarD [Robiginitomaculum sp.]
MNDQTKAGLLATLIAFFIWGLGPIYFKFLAPATAVEVSMHRAIWACVFVGLWLAVVGGFAEVRALFLQPRTLALLAISSLLITFNWFAYAWAVMNEQIAQASLGYFISPLINVLLGFVFLQEQFNRLRWIAVGLAALGVLNQVVLVGSVPLLALSLAFTFGFYGLLRKTVKAEAGPGLFIETLIVMPFLLVGLLWLETNGQGHAFNAGWGLPLLLVLGGALIAIPLFLFSYGARRLNLATVGLIQYIAPSMQFGLALWYGETFGWSQIMTFVLIWSGLALYTWDMRHQMSLK